MAYIEHNSRPMDNKTYETAEAAIAAFCAPAWAGAAPTEITMLSDTSFKSRGQVYYFKFGDNPTDARRAIRAEQHSKPIANSYARQGQWTARDARDLTRDMDRADSNN